MNLTADCDSLGMLWCTVAKLPNPITDLLFLLVDTEGCVPKLFSFKAMNVGS